MMSFEARRIRNIPAGAWVGVFLGAVLLCLYVGSGVAPASCTPLWNHACGPHQANFLGRCFCEPGYKSPRCVTKNDRVKECDCKQKASSLRCAQLCLYNDEAGITRSTSMAAWKEISDAEFKVWNHDDLTVSDDRSDEHMSGFGQFSYFVGTQFKLGKSLEVGAGPYTQTKAIIQLTHAPVESITLAEPNIYRYVSLPQCSYKSGSLLGHNTILVSAKVEDLGFVEVFDTVIHMNVLEHVNDAFEYLTKMYAALKTGGVLIFHERWHTDVEAPVLGNPQNIGFQLHPVRVRRPVLDHLLSFFDPVYNNTIPTKEMDTRGYGEEAYYFVGIKKAADCKLHWRSGQSAMPDKIF